MLDIRKLKYFYYSQNSLNTFSKCPLKFKLKYMEDIAWRNDSPLDLEFYNSIKTGLDFHLICERYFSNIPIGIECCSEEVIKWTEALKRKMLINKNYLYFPEYEIKMVKDHIRLQAKYDLVIIKPDGGIEIWDWKTENRKLTQMEMEKRVQTIVYMYVIMERAKDIFGIDVKAEDIKMTFWQPHYEHQELTVCYSRDIHMKNEEYIEKLIRNIKDYNFEEDFNKELYSKQCKFCEFNYFCNNEKVNFSIIEESDSC